MISFFVFFEDEFDVNHYLLAFAIMASIVNIWQVRFTHADMHLSNPKWMTILGRGGLISLFLIPLFLNNYGEEREMNKNYLCMLGSLIIVVMIVDKVTIYECQ